MVSHVYDITYGVVKEKDNLVCVDDSIVRGTTLEKSVLKILSKTNPKKIVIASTAPQIRYPDCYGIDMSELGKFIAFRATISLLNEQGASGLIQEVYQDCCKQVGLPNNKLENHVKRLYDNFTTDQISKKVAELVYPRDTDWDGELEVIFQSIKKLHKSLPLTAGDWYFTGDYPTAGGYYVLNSAFINYYENKSGRSY
jgi:amidophosphoribosyltransferase